MTRVCLALALLLLHTSVGEASPTSDDEMFQALRYPMWWRPSEEARDYWDPLIARLIWMHPALRRYYKELAGWESSHGELERPSLLDILNEYDDSDRPYDERRPFTIPENYREGEIAENFEVEEHPLDNRDSKDNFELQEHPMDSRDREDNFELQEHPTESRDSADNFELQEHPMNNRDNEDNFEDEEHPTDSRDSEDNYEADVHHMDSRDSDATTGKTESVNRIRRSIGSKAFKAKNQLLRRILLSRMIARSRLHEMTRHKSNSSSDRRSLTSSTRSQSSGITIGKLFDALGLDKTTLLEAGINVDDGVVDVDVNVLKSAISDALVDVDVSVGSDSLLELVNGLLDGLLDKDGLVPDVLEEVGDLLNGLLGGGDNGGLVGGLLGGGGDNEGLVGGLLRRRRDNDGLVGSLLGGGGDNERHLLGGLLRGGEDNEGSVGGLLRGGGDNEGGLVGGLLGGEDKEGLVEGLLRRRRDNDGLSGGLLGGGGDNEASSFGGFRWGEDNEGDPIVGLLGGAGRINEGDLVSGLQGEGDNDGLVQGLLRRRRDKQGGLIGSLLRGNIRRGTLRNRQLSGFHDGLITPITQNSRHAAALGKQIAKRGAVKSSAGVVEPLPAARILNNVNVDRVDVNRLLHDGVETVRVHARSTDADCTHCTELRTPPLVRVHSGPPLLELRKRRSLNSISDEALRTRTD